MRDDMIIELCQQKRSDVHSVDVDMKTTSTQLHVAVPKMASKRCVTPPLVCPSSIEQAVEMRTAFEHITETNSKEYRRIVRALIQANKVDELAAFWVEEYWMLQLCVAELSTLKLVASSRTSLMSTEFPKPLTITELCKLAVSHGRDDVFVEYILRHMATHFPALF
jgi:hypothetical protein